MQIRFVVRATLAVAALIVLGTSGPASAAERSGRACFMARHIDSMGVSADNRTVYVRTRRDIWVLELFSPCIGADWSRHATLRSRTGSWICEGAGNAVDLHVRPSGRPRQRCLVNNVRKLTPAEAAAIPPGSRP